MGDHSDGSVRGQAFDDIAPRDRRIKSTLALALPYLTGIKERPYIRQQQLLSANMLNLVRANKGSKVTYRLPPFNI